MKIYVVMGNHYEYIFEGDGYYSTSISSIFSTKEKAEAMVSALKTENESLYRSWYEVEEYEVEE